MIGTCPRPLALSLYQTLISDHVWAESRARLGYRDTFPEPLIVSLAGRPYVDVRVSFNSFLPQGLGAATAEKLAEHYLDRLRAQPWLHDKVEFEIAFTCFTFDFDAQSARLRQAGLASGEVAELKAALGALTGPILRGEVEPIAAQELEIAAMNQRRERVLAGVRDEADSLASGVSHLLADCRRFGTLPFSTLARFAFVAKSLLRSLEGSGILAREELDALLADIPTVATRISADLGRLGRGQLSESEFLALYGHLRPGTYDVLSPSYGERPDLYLGARGGATAASRASGDEARAILKRKQPLIAAALARSGLDCTPEQLFDFLLAAIPARESAKFEFSKNVSAALGLAARLAERLGLDRDDLSFLPIERLLRLGSENSSPSLLLELRQLSGLNRKRHALARAIHLPPVITGPEDVDHFSLFASAPNFITQRSVLAPVTDLERGGGPGSLAGKIVLIRSADPGFDWIFGQPIAGLVTEFGGVASHMAIRAAEFGLPAAIGCGEVLYARARAAHVIELDCGSRQIRVVD
jgi:phosphohistidine swiveling domain-containing protein